MNRYHFVAVDQKAPRKWGRQKTVMLGETSIKAIKKAYGHELTMDPTRTWKVYRIDFYQEKPDLVFGYTDKDLFTPFPKYDYYI